MLKNCPTIFTCARRLCIGNKCSFTSRAHFHNCLVRLNKYPSSDDDKADKVKTDTDELLRKNQLRTKILEELYKQKYATASDVKNKIDNQDFLEDTEKPGEKFEKVQRSKFDTVQNDIIPVKNIASQPQENIFLDIETCKGDDHISTKSNERKKETEGPVAKTLLPRNRKKLQQGTDNGKSGKFQSETESEDWDKLSAQQLLSTSRADVMDDFQVEYPSDVTDNEDFFKRPTHDPTMHRFKNRPKGPSFDKMCIPSDICADNKSGTGLRECSFKAQIGAEVTQIEPRETTVLLFPGQGSQFVGMSKDLIKYPNVTQMFGTASEILGYDLLKLCLNGPKSELDKTIHCQPAVLVTSLAAVEKLRHENPEAVERCKATAGFSVGEYASLVFGGAISFEDAVHIVNVRAKAMQQASEEVSSGMMTVFIGANTNLYEACLAAQQYMRERIGIEHPVCHTANFLFTCGRVLAGHTEGLYFIEKVHKEFNIKRVKHLPVSGAFHTILMQSAKEPVRQALLHAHIQQPVIWCYSNVTGHRHSNKPNVIRKFLEKQITNQVLWEQIICNIYRRGESNNFPTTYECGPGNQLLTMLKLTNGKAFKSAKRITV